MKKIRLLLLLVSLGAPLFAQSDSAVAEYLGKEYGVRFTEGNAVRLLPSARAKYAALEKDLREAQQFIHFDYFNLRGDSVSQVVWDILAERAAAGVKVRVILDAFGSTKGNNVLTDSLRSALRQKDIDVRIFSEAKFPWFPAIMHRDHRKIAIIDGKVGYTGGMNIADYYLTGTEQAGEWRDMHLRIEGPVVEDLHRVFVNFWEAETKTMLPQCEQPIPHDVLRVPEALLSASVSGDDSEEQRGVVGVVNRIPTLRSRGQQRTHRIMRDATCKAIDAAEHHIQIVNPYFAPSPKIRRALRRALRRGVNVELMISAKSDVRVTPRVVEYSAWRLARKGAKVWVYESGFHHSKVMTVDDRFSFVGSANFDHRSMYSDYECNVMIADRAVTDSLQTIFAADVEQSALLTKENWRKRYSLAHRIRCRLAAILRPLL